MNKDYKNSNEESDNYECSGYPYNIDLQSTSFSSPLINDVLEHPFKKEGKTLDFTGARTELNGTEISNFPAKFPQSNLTVLPQYFTHGNRIMIPTKLVYTLGKYIPQSLLKKIHSDIDVAKEMCLLFTTQLTSTYFDLLNFEHSNGWKALKSEYLRNLLSTSPKAYKYVIEALKHPLRNGPILECDNKAAKGIKSYNYRLGDSFIGKGIVSYELKTDVAIHLLNRHHQRLHNEALKNPICENLMQFYSSLTLPSIELLIQEGKRLVKEGHKSKKGKKYAQINKHKKDCIKYSYIEDGVNRFINLTQNGLMIPRAGSKASGGRVIDSIVLLNSWVRNLIKVDGEAITECDYSCLHPNIAMLLYGGTEEYITHEKIANATGIPIELVKKEHLSFFNKRIGKMLLSPLYEYYSKTQPKMVENITNDKRRYGHRITSQRMFEKEVLIMSDVVVRLNQEGIYVGYGYDALFSSRKHNQRVIEVMNKVILDQGVKTTAKGYDNNSCNPELDWAPVTNYENYYQINEQGQVKSLHKHNYGYIMQQRKDRGGYYTVRLNKPEMKSSTQYVHRLLGLVFIPNPENKPMINHKDGNKLNNHISNLEWVTHSENMAHAYKEGLVKIKTKPVIDMCKGETYVSIKEAAKAINIDYGTCRNYLNGNIKTNKTCLRLAS